MNASELISFLQQKGFVWGPSPEVYGGLSGFYTYAPMGKLLKNRVEEHIRKHFQKNDFWEVECPTIMPSKVWEASGHLGGFTDDIVTCKKCGSSFKIELIINSLLPNGKQKNYQEVLKKQDFKCLNCGAILPKEVKKHNLMMKTLVGIDTEAFLRPETATTTYLPFIRYYDFFRKKLPFGVFQIGKAYRNEISPRQHIIRMREFTQAEAQLFIFPKQKKEYDIKKIENEAIPLISNKGEKLEKKTIKEALKAKLFKNQAYAWAIYVAYSLFKEMGFKEENLRLKQHSEEEMAFYADDAWDLEIKTDSFGWVECCGIHDRTDYDVKQHENFSKTCFEVMDEDNNKNHPHILEIAFGTDRPVFCLLDNFYDIKSKKDGKTVFKIKPSLSPITIAVLPLVKKESLPEIGRKIYQELKQEFTCTYDESASVGKRYLREAEKGTALCVTVDFETIKNNTVTLRERDTEKQIRVKIDELRGKILAYLRGEKLESLGKKV